MNEFTLDSDDLTVLRSALAAYSGDIAMPEYKEADEDAGWRSAEELGDPYWLIDDSVCLKLENLALLEVHYSWSAIYRITQAGRKVLAAT